MIRAKKSLGQNFLIDRDVLEKITNVVQIKDKNILEVGPGTGNLISFILKKNPKKMFVIEKDDELAINLSETFKDQLTIINDDILQVDENSIFKKNQIFKVGRYHSLKLKEPFKINNFDITMRCLESKVAMAFENKKDNIYGFQFHPESFLTNNGNLLIKKILSA